MHSLLHDARLPSSLCLIPRFLLPSTQVQPEPVCLNPAPFTTVAPLSRPLTMALANATTRVVSQFDFSDADINRHVDEFLRQMGKSAAEPSTRPLLTAVDQTMGWARMAAASARSPRTSQASPTAPKR